MANPAAASLVSSQICHQTNAINQMSMTIVGGYPRGRLDSVSPALVRPAALELPTPVLAEPAADPTPSVSAAKLCRVLAQQTPRLPEARYAINQISMATFRRLPSCAGWARLACVGQICSSGNTTSSARRVRCRPSAIRPLPPNCVV